ncbi:hypothetical protein KBJ94_22790 [Pseudomonas sp. ITA]|uniref:hypothetical protein n=1 Tax=Pseudomonas sp. ITA TaxID=2825841 RepID=UPI002498AE49|nr:hypothetical protein [Pseudomonas sp. ITA]MDI2144883.1 hypothetical protein [Pseudomonas sp. ITA]
MTNPFKQHLRLKRPCSNFPFLKLGAIKLAPGRLDEIIAGLIEDDHSTFRCHKTVHSARGGKWDDEGNYPPSGHESMCAGATAYLMKRKQPTVEMRIAFAMGVASPDDWDDAQTLTIE